ncbi:MAG: sulfatase-like hydrolase/transferase [Akkermansiaceae bacterium]
MVKLLFRCVLIGLSFGLVSVCVAGERPNIILVMADDQGYGDVGYNGHPFLKTPNLDAMAEAGVVVNRFYAAAPVCSPTRASVMTGRHPMRVNVPHHGHYMRPNENTLAEGLKSAGYVTGHFGKWHIGSVQPESPTSPGKVGFDEWLSGLNFFDNDPYLVKNGEYVRLEGQGSVLTMDATLEFLERHKDGGKPMFAVTWFPAPHLPHLEVPAGLVGDEGLYKEAGENRGYYLEIALIDEQVGRLRKGLREMEIEQDTIVWYCSDNGGLVEEFSGGRGRKGSVYEGGLRVPCVVEWPGKLTSRVCNVPMTTSCMYPTLMNLAGAKIPDARPLDGRDQFRNIMSRVKSPGVRKFGFWHHHTAGQNTSSDAIIKGLMEAEAKGDMGAYSERLMKNVLDFPQRKSLVMKGHAAWVDWPWKLHRIQRGKGGEDDVVLELYHLVKDPMEEENVLEKESRRVEVMLQELRVWQDSVLGSWEGRDYPELPALKRRR